MPLYEYNALDARGKKRTGLIDAGTLQTARERLKGQGFFVVSLGKAAAKEDVSAGRSLTLFSKVSRSDLAVLTRQLSTLLKAGLPLVQALEALIEQMEKPAVRKVLNGVQDRVNEGAPFHEALAEFPSVFPPLYVQMVRAGEAGGFLESIMLRLSETLENEARLRGKVVAAMVYPVFMTVLGFVFLLLLFAFVVPEVAGIFEDFGRQLPLPTRILISLSDFANAYWVPLLVAFALFIFLFRRSSKSDRFGPSIDRLKLRMPVFGKLTLKVATVRMCHILGSLLRSGVPLMRSLEVVGEVLGNRVLSSALDQASISVSRGGSLAESLRANGVFPALLPRVVAVGEESGDLADMLTSVAESYEEETTTSIQALTAVLGPVLILVMAAVVLFVVLAILLPIFEMNQLIRTA